MMAAKRRAIKRFASSRTSKDVVLVARGGTMGAGKVGGTGLWVKTVS